MSGKKIVPSLPIPLFNGRVELATYRDQEPSGYRNNPMIEALPDVLSPEQVMKAMMYYPEFKEEYRTRPGYLRFHFIYDAITDFFQPLSDHLDIEEKFSRMIRCGYKARNPTRIDFWVDLRRRLELLKKNMGLDFEDLEDDLQRVSEPFLEHIPEQEPVVCTCGNARAFGFNMIGISGIGKTTVVQKVLSLYPQIIFHSRYRDRDFPWTQIVWLKLDVPHDASIKGLCLNFFQAVDSILSTNYFDRFTRDGKATATEMIPRMAWVAGFHTIGVLAFDELQNLNVLSSGGYQVMLNFFVRLDNDMGIPIQETGTYGACKFLGKQLHKARRGTGQGDKFWHPMRNDKKWEHFLESLWQYQYVRNPVPLGDLKDVMHDVTQGITDFAINVFMLSQIRAIKIAENRGGEPGGESKEILSESVIRSVAADSLNSARPILDALRRRDKDALRRYEDTRIDWETVWSDELEVGDNLPLLVMPALDGDDEQTVMMANEKPGETSCPVGGNTEEKSSSQRPKRKLGARALKGSLPKLLERAEEKKVLAYDALKEAGYIRNPDEFLQAEVS